MPRSSRPYLSVVIPAYNEEERLGATLEKVAFYLHDRKIDSEILVVDDGSTDSTRSLAERYLRDFDGRVLSQPENYGKGAAVRRGILEADGRWVLITDADLSTPIEDYETLAAYVRDRDMDGAIGSRGLADSQVEIPQHAVRQFMGRTFNTIIRLLTRLPYRDTQCGFKLLDRERVLPLFERMVVNRFAFDVEFLFLCARFGLQIAEVPVTWRNDPATSVSMILDPANMIYDVIRVRWRFRRGLYDPTKPPADVRDGGGAS